MGSESNSAKDRCQASPKMPDRQKSYKVVALSMYVSDAAEADRLTEVLRRAGWPKANRSLVVREALLELQEELTGKSDEEIFQFFLARFKARASKRAGGSARSPDVLPEVGEHPTAPAALDVEPSKG